MTDTSQLLAAVPLHPIEQESPGAETPAPSHEQEQVADGVFSTEQEKLAALVIGMQAGIGALHALALDAFAKPKEVEPACKPRRKEEEKT